MKIEIGMRVQYAKRTTEGDNRSKIKKWQGTVVGVYPHIFNVVFDGKQYSESFPYCLLDAKGNECVKIV